MEIIDIKREIERIRKAQFMNAMKDHMTEADYAFDRKCEKDIQALKEQLKEAVE